MKIKPYKIIEVDEKYFNTLTTDQKQVLKVMDDKFVREMKWAEEHPSERNFNKAEKLTGIAFDWSDRDYGEPPVRFNK